MGFYCRYMQDILWISWFVHVGTMFSDWFWLVYCVVCGFSPLVARISLHLRSYSNAPLIFAFRFEL